MASGDYMPSGTPQPSHPTHATPPGAAPALDVAALGASLAGTPGVDEWQAQVIHAREAQLYIIGDRVESRRTVTNERAVLRILNDHAPHGAPATAAAAADAAPPQPVRGWSTITLLAADAADPSRLAARLAEGVFMAGLTDNSPYYLPTMPPNAFPAVHTVDPTLVNGLSLDQALEAARAQLEAAVAHEAGVRLASAEFYVTQSQTTMRNSRGLDAVSAGTLVFLDFILIARDGEHEAEVHGEFERRRLADLAIPQMIAAQARFARDTLRATTPRTFKGPVVVSGLALRKQLADIFSPLIVHTSAEAKFQGLSRFQIGAPITPEPARGDRITLMSDATRPFFTRTAPFDADGVPASRVTLVEDGVLRAHWATQRYAEYLGIPATGEFANLVLGLGTHSLAELRAPADGPVYEIVEFSGITPDPLTGDFASEIRLGYRYDPDGRVTPIKGGSVSGNLFAALADAHLASEPFATGNYYGPAAIRFAQLTIAGD